MLQHVALEVRRADAERCAAFDELLGFARVEPPETLRERALWLERRGTQLHLMWVEEPVALPRGHVAVVVDDWDATLAALRGAGFDPEPRRAHWGAARAYVRDPAGNLVELMAFGPASSHT